MKTLSRRLAGRAQPSGGLFFGHRLLSSTHTENCSQKRVRKREVGGIVTSGLRGLLPRLFLAALTALLCCPHDGVVPASGQSPGRPEGVWLRGQRAYLWHVSFLSFTCGGAWGDVPVSPQKERYITVSKVDEEERKRREQVKQAKEQVRGQGHLGGVEPVPQHSGPWRTLPASCD